MGSILTSQLKRIEKTPGELEELGKILGKTYGLGPTKRKHRWKGMLNR